MKVFWLVFVAVCLPACNYAKPLSSTTGEGDAETEEAPVLFIKGIGNIPVTVLDGPLATPPADTSAPTESRLPQTTESTAEPQVPATEKNTPPPTTEQVKTTSAASAGRGRQTAGSARSTGSRRAKEATTTTTTEPTTTTKASKSAFGRNRKQSPVASASTPSRTFSPTPKNFATTIASSTPAAEVEKPSFGRSRSKSDGLSDFLKARRRERIESTTEADPIAPILAKTKASSDADGARGGRRRTTSRGTEGTTATTTTVATPVEVTAETKSGRNRFSVPKTTKSGRSVATTTSKPVVAEQPAASESKPLLLPKKPIVFRPAAPSPLLRKSAQTTTQQPANALDDLAGANPEAIDETVVIEHEAPAPTPAPAKPLRGSARGLRSGTRA